MKYIIRILLNLGLTLLISCSFSDTEIQYTTAKNPWPEKYGNHRAVIKADKSAEALELDFLWRRHDKDPHDKRFIIVHSESGDTISNILRKEVNNERCHIVFGPVEKTGEYHFYYLPYAIQINYGFYGKGHLIPENDPDREWVKMLDEKTAEIPKAKVLGIEARTEFDSFYPMEVIAREDEKISFVEQHKKEYYLFPEDRLYPIRMMDNVPSKWINKELDSNYSGTALLNEYFVYQIGVWAQSKKLENLTISFSDLKNGDEILPATSITCFNTEGYDPDGTYFTKNINVDKDMVQALWIGLDISEDMKPGDYSGQAHIKADNAESQSVNINIKIKKEQLADRGDSDLWRHSRLRWLNSSAGIDKNPVKRFTAINSDSDEKSYELNGSTISLTKNGLPAQINVRGVDILASPVNIDLKTSNSNIGANLYELVKMDKFPGVLEAEYECDNKEVVSRISSVAEADGYIRFNLNIKAKENISIEDVSLNIPFRKDIAEYMMGMGLPGCETPAKHSAGWKGPHDSFWIGNTYGGLHCELRGSSYHGPLLNLYKPAPPVSWHNDGSGGFKINSNNEELIAKVYSGKRDLKEGESIDFEFALLITPIFELDSKRQFTQRYYHNGGDPAPDDDELEAGVEIINLHHANEYNPHINYPFIAADEMKGFIKKYQEKGKKVKIYYTIRELTNFVPEIWALRSLGDEIIGDGRGGGFTWLREHFVDHYTPQWYHRLDSLKVDASVLTSTGESRWFNYYVEGLAWMVEHYDIDGLYLDDVSFDRRMLKRMRKVMDEIKPGCIIDLHSNTGFSKGPATQYAEFFPYVDKLWFGESFMYNEMSPANWLVEVSGIPFGHMGDMLHGGGNPWRGMVYGMTVRYPWTTEGVTCNPLDIWKVWDDFDIANSRMVGYWDKESLIKTTNPDVLLTYYQHEDKILISLASWAKKEVKINIRADWEKLGFNADEIILTAPEIKNFQPAKEFKPEDFISVDPKKGYLLVGESVSR